MATHGEYEEFSNLHCYEGCEQGGNDSPDHQGVPLPLP